MYRTLPEGVRYIAFPLHFLCISAEVEIFAQGPAHNSNIIANFADTQIP